MTMATTLDRMKAVLPGPQAPWIPLSGGRTNRVWRVGARVVKVYAPDADSPLFPNDPEAEARALVHFGPMGLAPRLVARGDGWVAYDHVPGQCWRSGPEDVARLLARLHQSKAPAEGFRPLAGGSAALQAQVCRLVGLACPGVPMPKVALVAPAAACPLHGDAVPGNIIRKPDGGLCLIDWQCPAIGDPAEDLAVFLSPAMQQIYRGVPLSAAEVDAFLNAYPDPATADRYLALKPLFHLRMAAHCLWRAARGAEGYEQAARLELSQIGAAPL
jgi:hypothetical protein